MKKIYTAIDIGSDTIKFIVGEYFKNKLNILSIHEEKSKGIRKGLIVDPNLAINSIKDGIKEINNNLGINIKKVVVGVPSYNSKFMFVTGEVDISNDEVIILGEYDNVLYYLLKNKVYKYDPMKNIKQVLFENELEFNNTNMIFVYNE